MSKWISINDELPKSRQEVLLLFTNKKIRIGYYVDGAGIGESKRDIGFFGIDNIRKHPTHWMPLPEPPK